MGDLTPLVNAPPIVRRDERAVVPLSLQQARRWDAERRDVVGGANVFGALRIEGMLHMEDLQAALDEVVKRQEALRTAFVPIDGVVCQQVRPPWRVPIHLVDLTHVSASDRARMVEEKTVEAVRARFELSEAMLLAAWVLRLAPAEHIVVVVVPHLVSDGWSIELIANDVVTVLDQRARGAPASLTPLSVHYADFALWQREWVRGEAAAAIADYYDTRLADARELIVPTDHARADVSTRFETAECPFCLTPALSTDVWTLSARERVTPFIAVLGCYHALLALWTGQSDVLLMAPFANRTNPQMWPMVGYCLNLCAIRTDLSGDPSVREIVRRTQASVLEAGACQRVPQTVLEELAAARGRTLPRLTLSVNNLADLQKIRRVGLTGGGTFSYSRYEIHIAGARQRGDLSLVFDSVSRQRISGRLIYRSALFEPGTIRRVADTLEAIVAGAVTDPDQRLSQCGPAALAIASLASEPGAAR